MKLLFLLLLLLLATLSDSFTGKVVRVIDGDTIEVFTDNNKRIRVRLEGIDTPERGQPFTNVATDLTEKLCASKMVTVINSGEDRYGRTLGFIYVGDVNVNRELLRNGFAWHYKHFNKDPELAELEQQARQIKLVFGHSLILLHLGII